MISVSENQSVLLQNKILMHLYIASCMKKKHVGKYWSE